jgi:cytosine/adenosine deaminase-related metal-dependent hydrolase
MSPQSSAAPGISLINARISGGALTSLRVAGARIAALGMPAQPGDAVLDLGGDRLLPGLINAHDHLQLNNLLPGGFEQRFGSISDWFNDVGRRRMTDPAFAAGVAVPREERLLAGGLKNLLSGVTTVAHHDPLYAALTQADFPVRVVHEYGWSHSLQISGEEQLAQSYRNTPRDWPWIVHAAEGVNSQALAEFDRLDALGCLGPNTLLVHGIALDALQRERLANDCAGLIWCPASNLNLFGATAEVTALHKAGRVAIGTDSRLSGSRDLLDELQTAASVGGFDEEELLAMATSDSARLLRLHDRGELRPGACADLLILPADKPLAKARRADVRLVMINGCVRYADPDVAQRLGADAACAPVIVDGVPKMLDKILCTRWPQVIVREPGLEWAMDKVGAA